MSALKQQIITACHALVKQRLDSGPFGNVSIRIPGTNEYWVNPEGVTFDQLTVNHLVRVNTSGEMLEGDFRPHPGDFIHREIYKRRADVNAIVHTHSDYTVAISLLGCVIEPYTQLGASIYTDQGLYLGFSGPVRDSNEGAAIAAALADKAIVLAKNHGLFAAGATIQSALWDMIVADSAAKVHVQAMQMGLTKADTPSVQTLEKSKREVRQGQCDAMWESFCRNARLIASAIA